MNVRTKSIFYYVVLVIIQLLYVMVAHHEEICYKGFRISGIGKNFLNIFMLVSFINLYLNSLFKKIIADNKSKYKIFLFSPLFFFWLASTIYLLLKELILPLLSIKLYIAIYLLFCAIVFIQQYRLIQKIELLPGLTESDDLVDDNHL